MSPAEIEYRLARSLDHFKVRQTQGDHPDPEEYLDELGDAYEEFLEILDLEQMLDDVLDPSPEGTLPREFGPYTLVREIGRGAVGIVYEGIHRDLGRHEAVKILRTGFDEEGTALTRFRQEAKVLARVHHDHIVEIYGAGHVDGRPYYAMTLLEGRTLSQIARSGELPSFDELCRGLAHVADALQMLHEQGVVHRDVKPSNILLTDDGRMVLADFGLARSLQDERITRTGQALGTPLYMSREQILGRRDDVDGRSDVYGLGATLYEVCAGRPVFQTDDLRALLQMVIHERPTSLRKVALDVPGPCADIAMKALEKRRRDRYQSAAAMRDDLLAFAQGERVRGRPVSVVRHGLRRMRAYALPIAAMLLLALAWGIWFVNRPGEILIDTDVAGVVASVNGGGDTAAPATFEVDPGTHLLRLQKAGFPDFERTVEVDAGQSKGIAYILPAPLLNDDPDALASIADASRVKVGPFGSKSLLRGADPWGPEFAAHALFPGGPVRLADLDDYYLEIDPTADVGDTRLVFRRASDGEPDVLYDERFDEPNLFRVAREIPERVMDQLAVGDVVTWELVVPGESSLAQTFTVVAEDENLVDELARVDEALAMQDEPVRAAFRAQALLNAGLATAAWKEASRLTMLADLAVGVEPSAKPGEGLNWLVMGAAVGEVDRGRTSGLFGRVANVVAYLPKALRDAWLPAGD